MTADTTAAGMQRHPCAYGAVLATSRAPIRVRHACGQSRASGGPAEQTNSLFSSLQALTQTASLAATNAGQPRGGGAHTRRLSKSDATYSAPAAGVWPPEALHAHTTRPKSCTNRTSMDFSQVAPEYRRVPNLVNFLQSLGPPILQSLSPLFTEFEPLLYRVWSRNGAVSGTRFWCHHGSLPSYRSIRIHARHGPVRRGDGGGRGRG